MSEQEAREYVLGLLNQMAEPYTWVTGEVELHTRGGGPIPGTLKSADDSSVVLATSTGDQRIGFSEIVNVIVQMASPGPE